MAEFPRCLFHPLPHLIVFGWGRRPGSGRGGREGGSGSSEPGLAPAVFSGPAAENARTLPRAFVSGAGSGERVRAKGLKCNLLLFTVARNCTLRVFNPSTGSAPLMQSRLAISPPPPSPPVLKGRGEIALQLGITGTELAEGVKTGSERARAAAPRLSVCLGEPPHYTAVVAIETTRREGGSGGDRQPDMRGRGEGDKKWRQPEARCSSTFYLK